MVTYDDLQTSVNDTVPTALIHLSYHLHVHETGHWKYLRNGPTPWKK